jgi:prepilin-type processing-associated H-X9-DG protein
MQRPRTSAFTLIELLIVISIIMILATILLPSLRAAKELARASQCQANLHALGVGMGVYGSENGGRYWPYSLPDWPRPGVRCYFWGTDSDPVEVAPSPFLKACSGKRELLLCPMMPWGSYTPQGAYVSEPTTTYAYNGRYLDPKLDGRMCKGATNVPRPADLFVLADSGLSWSPAGVTIFQNSTYLEPVSGSWVQTPTNHFRHRGRTNTLCADGHVGIHTPEGWPLDPKTNLGFVGTNNYPHYEQ